MPKLLYGAVFARTGIFYPYCFDNETVREAEYYELLNTYVRISRHSFPWNYLFQQDKSPIHISNVVRTLFDSLFPDSWIGKHGPYNWPTGSFDLPPPDFFLWELVEDELFRTSVRHGILLKLRITRAIRSIQQETFQKVWKNLDNRLYAIIREDGGRIEHLQLCTKTLQLRT